MIIDPQRYRLSVTVHTLPRLKRREKKIRREKQKFSFSWKSANEAPIVGRKVINERGNLRLLLLWWQPASELWTADATGRRRQPNQAETRPVTSCTSWCEGIQGWIHKQGNLTSMLSQNITISSSLSVKMLRLGTDVSLFCLDERYFCKSDI